MSQVAKLLDVLLDGQVHTVPELLKRVYGLKKPSSARLAARIYELRQRGYEIFSDKTTRTKWWYRLKLEKQLVFRGKNKRK